MSGYRKFQGDVGQGVVTCPRCHELFVPLGEGAMPRAQELPDGFPVLSPEQLAARVAEHQPATARLHDALRESVADSTFGVWLAPLRLVGADGDTLYALAPAEIVEWIRDRFGRVLEAAASALAGRAVKVVVGGAA